MLQSDKSINASDGQETTIISPSEGQNATFFGPFVDPRFVKLVNCVLWAVTPGINPQDAIETKVL